MAGETGTAGVMRVGADLASVLLGAEIADLKDVDYRNTLAICTLIELLCDRGLIRREDFAAKARTLDLAAEPGDPARS
jgi:hypothetical protein